MLFQLLYMGVSLIPTMLLYRSQWVHGIYIILFALVGIWNGANYYFDGTFLFILYD